MTNPQLFPPAITDLGPTNPDRLVRRTDPDTSRLAANAASSRSPTQRTQVWQALLELGNATDYELSRHLSILRSSAAKRRQELTDVGLVEDTGLRRPTDTDSPAIVWRPCLPEAF